jgi:hypothetical protein
MIKLTQDVDLALKPRQEPRIDGQFGRQYLDGSLRRAACPTWVATGKVDTAHAAAAEFSVENPRTESCADHDGSPVWPRFIVSRESSNRAPLRVFIVIKNQGALFVITGKEGI